MATASERPPEVVALEVKSTGELNVGETIEEDRFLIVHNGEVKADMPLSRLSSSAPEYDRPWEPSEPAAELADVPQIDPIDGLKALIASPNYCSREWVYEQYDSQVMADTMRIPGFGSGVIRVHGTEKKLAFTSDVTPRYVKANPVEGGKQAVAEAYRNLTAVGALPLATTDNLNFGNPEKPEIMGQFVEALRGAASRFGAKASFTCPPQVNAATALIRAGAEPYWCWYMSNDHLEVIAFKLVDKSANPRAYGIVVPLPLENSTIAWESVDVGPLGELLLAGSTAESFSSQKNQEGLFNGTLLYRDVDENWWMPNYLWSPLKSYLEMRLTY